VSPDERTGGSGMPFRLMGLLWGTLSSKTKILFGLHAEEPIQKVDVGEPG